VSRQRSRANSQSCSDHVENDGRLLFEQIVKLNLEGMICKRKSSPYRLTEKPSPNWIKVKNPRYSQAEGREEMILATPFCYRSTMHLGERP
jgi:ATP-dependent DNA ligase